MEAEEEMLHLLRSIDDGDVTYMDGEREMRGRRLLFRWAQSGKTPRADRPSDRGIKKVIRSSPSPSLSPIRAETTLSTSVAEEEQKLLRFFVF